MSESDDSRISIKLASTIVVKALTLTSPSSPASQIDGVIPNRHASEAVSLPLAVGG
jgi:hypothetical protein